jgi:hypothetical protein
MPCSVLSIRGSVKMALSIGLLTAACSRDNSLDKMTPNGTITGAIPPVAGVGSATSVTATASDGTTYTTIPNAQTGAFTIPLPAGTYTLTFITTLSAPNAFPARVPVTVVAGATASPTLPPLTHDNVKRGLLRWTVDGTTYTANWLGGQFGDRGLVSDSKGYFYLSGTAGEFDKSPEVAEVFLVVPEASRKGVIFVGPATYTLGGEETGSFGEYTYYAGGRLAGFSRYTTPTYPGTPTGTLRLTRYDANLGVAAGIFEFVAAAYANATGQRTITSGEFNITF